MYQNERFNFDLRARLLYFVFSFMLTVYTESQRYLLTTEFHESGENETSVYWYFFC